MQKKLHFFFLIIVAALTLALFFTAPKPTLQVKKQIIPPSSAQQTAINLTATQPKQDGVFTVFIKLQKGTSNPHLAQIELGYDPRTLEATQIYPGDIFINPTILIETINNNSGRISIALSCTPKKGEKTCIDNTREILAAVQFRQTGYAGSKQSPVKLLPKTMLLDADNKEIPIQKRNTQIQTQAAAPQTASAAAQ